MRSHTNMYSYDSVTMYTKQHVINTHADITDQLNYTSDIMLHTLHFSRFHCCYSIRFHHVKYTYLAFFKASLLLQYQIL